MDKPQQLQTVYLSLGSNISPRRQRLAACIEGLGGINGVTLGQVSGVYESEPEGMAPGAAAFLNQVVIIQTSMSPSELLQNTEALERKMGRKDKSQSGQRGQRGQSASRTIDIDILLFGEQVIDTEKLVVPHPRLHLRAFALIPLLELDNTLKNPNNGHPYQGLVNLDLVDKVTRLYENDIKDTNKLFSTSR